MAQTRKIQNKKQPSTDRAQRSPRQTAGTAQRSPRQADSASQRRTRPSATGRLNALRQRRMQSRRTIMVISFIVIAFCIVMCVQMVQKYSTLSQLKEQESKLIEQREQELQLSEELKEQEAYVKTDEYVEEMARRMGLLYPDEVIFKPEE